MTKVVEKETLSGYKKSVFKVLSGLKGGLWTFWGSFVPLKNLENVYPHGSRPPPTPENSCRLHVLIQWGSEIWTSLDLEWSKKRLGYKWSRFGKGSKSGSPIF